MTETIRRLKLFMKELKKHLGAFTVTIIFIRNFESNISNRYVCSTMSSVQILSTKLVLFNFSHTGNFPVLHNYLKLKFRNFQPWLKFQLVKRVRLSGELR